MTQKPSYIYMLNTTNMKNMNIGLLTAKRLHVDIFSGIAQDVYIYICIDIVARVYLVVWSSPPTSPPP